MITITITLKLDRTKKQEDQSPREGTRIKEHSFAHSEIPPKITNLGNKI